MAVSTNTHTMEKLTGAPLKARVAEMKAEHATEQAVAIACGYVRLDGKANVGALKDALLEAHGLAIASPKASGGRGRSLGFRVTAGTKGQIVLSGGYSELIGVEPGGEVVIAHQGDTLVLSRPGAVPAACPAPTNTGVTTYDSTAQMAA
jgi:hypothetical protein